MKVALYARVSTADKGQDPEHQLRDLRVYAAARDWEAEEYVDYASAGDVRRRYDWARLLEDARRGQVGHVLVWKLDRAFRSSLHCSVTLEDFDRWHVGFSTVTQPIDTTGSTGRLLIGILAVVAQFERDLISERTKAALETRRAKGVQLGRREGSKDKEPRNRSGYFKRWEREREAKKKAQRRDAA